MSGFIQKGALVLVYIVVVYVNYLTITQSRNVLFMDDWGTPGSLFYSYFNSFVLHILLIILYLSLAIC